MKRKELLQHLEKSGCILLREGKRHSVYINPEKNLISTVPRHREIDNKLARKILNHASQIQILEIEDPDPIIKTEIYSYDKAGSINQYQYYLDDQLQNQVILVNNDNQRLTSLLGTQASFGDYVYDHLGQRVLKAELGYIIFVYDIFGNLIGEYAPDGSLIADYVYLGNNRLAKIQLPPEAQPPFPGCPGIVPTQPCGIYGIQAKTNWALMVILPLLVLLAVKFRQRKIILTGILFLGSIIIVLMLSKTAKTQSSPEEAVYYYHNDHLGTPKVMTSQAGNVVWEAIYQPFGEIDRYLVNRIPNNFRFPGQYEDELTELYYNHYRYYIPHLGRYNRLDLVYLFPCSYSFEQNYFSSTYPYSKNNPIIFLDSSGLATYRGACTYFSGGQFIGGGVMQCDVFGECGPDNIRQKGSLLIIFTGGLTIAFPQLYLGITVFSLCQKDDLIGRGDLLNLGGRAYLAQGSIALISVGGYLGYMKLGGTKPCSFGGIQAGLDISADFFIGISIPYDIKEECCKK